MSLQNHCEKELHLGKKSLIELLRKILRKLKILTKIC